MSENEPKTTAEAESFVGRWARRKRETQAEIEATPPEAGGETDATAPVDAESAIAEPAEPVKTDADMPPVESIDERSNVGDFFSSGVSKELRRMALRRLFHLPKYNFRDGLNDYDRDYRTFVPLGDTVTADMRLKQERLEEAARRLRDELQASNDDELTAPGADEALADDADIPPSVADDGAGRDITDDSAAPESDDSPAPDDGAANGNKPRDG